MGDVNTYSDLAMYPDGPLVAFGAAVGQGNGWFSGSWATAPRSPRPPQHTPAMDSAGA